MENKSEQEEQRPRLEKWGGAIMLYCHGKRYNRAVGNLRALMKGKIHYLYFEPSPDRRKGRSGRKPKNKEKTT